MAAPVTLITGTSTGIGKATALHLARRGHRVFATMRSPGRAGAPLLDVAKAEGLQLTVSQLDVTDEASVRRAIDAALKDAGRIDVLVNNAGLGDLSPIELMDDAHVHAMFETNVFGPLRAVRAVLPAMRAQGSGAIVNVSSVAGLIVGGINGIYAATKHALEAASESLALEVARFGVRVAIIEPGFFDTPIIDKATGAVPGGPDSPYIDFARQMSMVYLGAKPLAGDPQAVAETIERAITADPPVLRHVVGFDAQPFIDGRARMTDEEYVRVFGKAMTDEEFFAEFTRCFPMPEPT